MFSIRIANDDLTFSASHFITFEGGERERLHGHSYHVIAGVRGSLGDGSYVLDFVAVREVLKSILAEMDHRVLLPARHPTLQVARGAKEITVSSADCRWVFPEGDCLVLPVANTTTELLAEYIARRLSAELKARAGLRFVPEQVRIEVGEGTGFWATCELSGKDLA